MLRSPDRAAGAAWLTDLSQLARAAGFATCVWGESAGLPLLGFTRAGGEGAPRVYLSAGIHGDEPAGPLAVERLLRLGSLSAGVSWAICPLLNPGGWLQGTRETPFGVDLNRDYLAQRSPEVGAHRAWIGRVAPHDLYLSLHEDWEATGFYLYEINTSSWAPLASVILNGVAEVMPLEPLECIDEHMVCQKGYIAHPPEPDEPLGWPEAIYHSKLYPHLSYTFETPSTLDLETRVAAHVAAVQAAVEAFLCQWEKQRRDDLSRRLER